MIQQLINFTGTIQMTDSFMQNHQHSLDLQREEDEINWLGFGPDTEDTEDEDNFLSDHTCIDVLDDVNFELAPSWYSSLLAGDYCTYVFDKF